MRHTIIIVLLTVLVLVGCVQNGPRIGDVPIKIEPSQFIDYQFSLVSDTRIEIYTFSENGVALSWLGDKNGVKGPILNWRIVNERTLLLTVKEDSDWMPPRDLTSIHLEFRKLTSRQAITMDGKTFRREKIL